MELHLFEQTGELVRAMVTGGDDELRFRAHRRGVKVWFATERPARLHYEAQVIPAALADGVELGPGEYALEVGFHAEHGDDRRNGAVVDQLRQQEKKWRKALGPHAVAGPFLGNAHWGRLSEVWVEADLDDPDLAFELASRLVDYIDAVEPLLDRAE